MSTPIVLRGYQVSAVQAADRELDQHGRALIEACTGAGKTLMFAAIAERRRPKGRILVLAHREELLEQAGEKIARTTALSTAIEQADRRAPRPLPDVVIASVASLAQPARRATFAPDAFSLVIVDEAHHGTAPSYRTVLQHFAGAARLGVTATPHRADGTSLSLVFGRTVFRYPIRVAVRDGFLVDIRRRVELIPSLDLSKVRVTSGDFDDAELEAQLLQAPAVTGVAEAILRAAGDRPTVAFCAGVAHSRAVAQALSALRPGCADYASGERREGLGRFQRGEVQICTNTDLATEGFDYPPTACIALVRPTKSLGRCTQQVGRGTRLSPETGKRDLLVVEFVGGSVSGQVTTVGVVGPDLPERVRLSAEQLLDRQPSLSVLDALERAAAAAGVVTQGARKVRHVIDPMRLILSLDGMVMEPARPGSRPATPQQAAQLQDEGLVAAGLTIRQAALLLEGIRWRRQRHLSSPTEALELYRFGHAIDVPRDLARRHLATLRGAA